MTMDPSYGGPGTPKSRRRGKKHGMKAMQPESQTHSEGIHLRPSSDKEQLPRSTRTGMKSEPRQPGDGAVSQEGEVTPRRPKNKLYNIGEMAVELDVPRKYITAIRKAGAPFYMGKSRPKWVRKWIKKKAMEESEKRQRGP